MKFKFFKYILNHKCYLPKSIAFPQIRKLLCNNAGKCWSNESTHHWSFSHTRGKQIYIVHVPENLFINHKDQ